jgi:hypothetical protein
MLLQNIRNGNIWLNENNIWCRKCSLCSSIIKYGGSQSKYVASRSYDAGLLCYPCGQKDKIITDTTKEKMKGRIPWNKGKRGVQIHSEEAKQKMSNSKRGKTLLGLENI